MERSGELGELTALQGADTLSSALASLVLLLTAGDAAARERSELEALQRTVGVWQHAWREHLRAQRALAAWRCARRVGATCVEETRALDARAQRLEAESSRID